MALLNLRYSAAGNSRGLAPSYISIPKRPAPAPRVVVREPSIHYAPLPAVTRPTVPPSALGLTAPQAGTVTAPTAAAGPACACSSLAPACACDYAPTAAPTAAALTVTPALAAALTAPTRAPAAPFHLVESPMFRPAAVAAGSSSAAAAPENEGADNTALWVGLAVLLLLAARA